MQRQLSVTHFNTCTVIWLTGLQNSAVEQCIIQISCVENFKQVSHQHCNMGSLAEYCRAVNVSVEIQHEMKKNLISTSTFSPTTYILHHTESIKTTSPNLDRSESQVRALNRFGAFQHVRSRHIIFQFVGTDN